MLNSMSQCSCCQVPGSEGKPNIQAMSTVVCISLKAEHASDWFCQVDRGAIATCRMTALVPFHGLTKMPERIFL